MELSPAPMTSPNQERPKVPNPMGPKGHPNGGSIEDKAH